MAIATLRTLFRRDLTTLKKEITQYPDEAGIWKIANGTANSAGNLCLHLIGNLNAYIGAEIGKTGYIRNRDLEVSQKDVPRVELIFKIEATINVVDEALEKLTGADLSQEFPILVFKEKTTIEYMLIHLAGHLNYHLGQVNYHRRFLTS